MAKIAFLWLDHTSKSSQPVSEIAGPSFVTHSSGVGSRASAAGNWARIDGECTGCLSMKWSRLDRDPAPKRT